MLIARRRLATTAALEPPPPPSLCLRELHEFLSCAASPRNECERERLAFLACMRRHPQI
jgi:hypothetical protein